MLGIQGDETGRRERMANHTIEEKACIAQYEP